MACLTKQNSMNYREIIKARASRGLYSCLGLDIDPTKIPKCKLGSSGKLPINAAYDFLQEIISATADVLAAYKPNLAFYEQYGPEGMAMLQNIVTDIRNISKDILIIGDAKRGDIDNTNEAYRKALEMFDAITISPYLGGEANKPFFFDQEGVLRDMLVFVLCQTSNKGADEFQGLYTLDFNPAIIPDGVSMMRWFDKIKNAHLNKEILPMYQKVAKNAINWSSNVGFVTGATYPENMKAVRQIIGDDRFLLIPGYGKQAGGLEEALDAGMTREGGILVNTSRDALYASSGEDFASACRSKIIQLNKGINAFWEKKYGGSLV